MGGTFRGPASKNSPREGGYDGILHQGRAEEAGRQSRGSGKAERR